MNAITHTPAETVLLDLLEGAEDWRASARKAVEERGLPTRRSEAWKWSDLRRASQGIEAAGHAAFLLDGKAIGDTAELTNGCYELDFTATTGVSVASLVVTIPAGASVSVLERQTLEAGAFATVRTEYHLGEGADRASRNVCRCGGGHPHAHRTQSAIPA
mgnify:CR=1 FL=1